MNKETLSFEVKLPRHGDEAFEALVNQIAEAVYRNVADRLSKAKDAGSGDLEGPALT